MNHKERVKEQMGEVAASWENQSGRLPRGVGVGRNGKTGQISPEWDVGGAGGHFQVKVKLSKGVRDGSVASLNPKWDWP